MIGQARAQAQAQLHICDHITLDENPVYRKCGVQTLLLRGTLLLNRKPKLVFQRKLVVVLPGVHGTAPMSPPRRLRGVGLRRSAYVKYNNYMYGLGFTI